MIMPSDFQNDFIMIIPDDLSITGGIVCIPLIPHSLRVIPELGPSIDMESQNKSMIF